MRSILMSLAALVTLALCGACGENQCEPVVTRTCIDIRTKAQQFGTGSALPSPEDICSQVKWEEIQLAGTMLEKECAGPTVKSLFARRSANTSTRPRTPLDVAITVCDGLKLKILTPEVPELQQCSDIETAYEIDQEKQEKERKRKQAEDAKKAEQNKKEAANPVAPKAPEPTPEAAPTTIETPIPPPTK